MPHKENLAGSPNDWLNHAFSDLNLSKIGKSPDVFFENLCFHAQQAVEKALKGLLVHFEIVFPRTHNIKILIDLLSKKIEIPDQIKKSALLTDYAVTTRYPGDYEEIDENEYLDAVKIAETVLDWVKKNIK